MWSNTPLKDKSNYTWKHSNRLMNVLKWRVAVSVSSDSTEPLSECPNILEASVQDQGQKIGRPGPS